MWKELSSLYLKKKKTSEEFNAVGFTFVAGMTAVSTQTLISCSGVFFLLSVQFPPLLKAYLAISLTFLSCQRNF